MNYPSIFDFKMVQIYILGLRTMKFIAHQKKFKAT